MDLDDVTEILVPRDRVALPEPRPHDAFLAGGTWVFSEPQPGIRRLIDLTALGWPALTLDADGLEIAATCSIGQLANLDLPGLAAGPLVVSCCRALLGSFKIWNMATVGGNLCLALPAAPMAALATALQGRCIIWCADGGSREIAAEDFITDNQQTALRAGEVLRAVRIPRAALNWRHAFRQISLTLHGRSAALLIGSLVSETGEFALTVTAATRRPLRLRFPGLPEARALKHRLAADIPAALYHDDLHGAPAWRRAMTAHLAEEIRVELSA
jgi:CO/xanthine dehydrogenase FAD-binding subunit